MNIFEEYKKTSISLLIYSALYITSKYIYPLFNRNKNGYGSTTTAEQVIGKTDLQGNVILITGVTNGIGKETARVLSKTNAKLILAGRNMKQLNELKESLINSSKNKEIYALELDLESLESVENFVKEFLNLKLTLNYLILNAGKIKLQITKEYKFHHTKKQKMGLNPIYK
jgi:hypothetical protein